MPSLVMKSRRLAFAILNFLIAALLTWLPGEVPLVRFFPLYLFSKALEMKHCAFRREPQPMK